MSLPLVNVFSEEYRKYSYRKATKEEGLAFLREHGYCSNDVRDKLLECIWFAQEAAEYMCRVGADNGLESFIDHALDKSINFEKMISSMPSETPSVLLDYKTSPVLTNPSEVDHAIDVHGRCLSDGQYLFHGGNFDDFKDDLVTKRPLSTSFCPQIALRNAEWCGKAYRAGKVDLLVLKVTNPKTKVFVYDRAGEHSNEKEILFSSGASLVVKKIKTVKFDHRVYATDILWETVEKHVPCSLIEVEIS
ncbi:hypothetical protein ACEUCM_05815 [Aeromonas dhakensis]|uniref:hypothetical protein n=1 Tax=Aeromonas dhakensis TaxID=196024 RepID=UPI0038D00B08